MRTNQREHTPEWLPDASAPRDPPAWLVWPLVVVGLLGVLAGDALTPLGFPHGLLYAPVVALAGWSGNGGRLLVVTVLACMLTLAGILISAPGVEGAGLALVLANRALSCLVLLLVCGFSLLAIRRYGELKRAHEALHRQGEEVARSGRLLRVAAQVGQLGGWTLDLRTGHIRWSEEVAAIHGQSPDQPPSLEEGLAFYVPEHRERLRRCVERCQRDGKAYDEELEIVDRKGRRRWVRAVGQPVRDEGGKIVGLEGALQDIDARKRVESTLAQSEARFRRLADAMPLCVWASDAQGRLNYFGKPVTEYFGLDHQALCRPHQIAELIHREDLESIREEWRRSIALGVPYAAEVRLRRKDGCYRWHLAQAVPIREEGNIVAWYGASTDIEDQKLLELEAHRLARRLSTTLEAINDGFLLLDAHWKIRFVNQQAERITRNVRANMLDRGIWEVFPEARDSRFETEYRSALAEGRPSHFTEFYPALGIWLEVRAYPTPEGLAIYFSDISEKRAAEAQLRLLETSIARINDIVLITEAEQIDEPGPRIVYVNPAFEKRTGYSSEEVLGRSPRLLQGARTQREELQRIRDCLSRFEPVRAQLINYTKSGEEFWLELDIVPIGDQGGRFTHFVAVERDITERVKLEEQLRQAQRMESVGQLTGGIAHDFNNLLTVILGNGELLLELDEEAERRELLQMIVGAASRGAQLTQRLLAFARRQTLEPRSRDINALLEGLLPLLRRSLGEHVEIRLETDSGLRHALIDASQLENAVLNLSLNARDAMPNGGVVSISTRNLVVAPDSPLASPDFPAGAYVQIEVADNGAGIPQAMIARVFEPFFTTKDKGKGTGLGLSMVYGFIKQSQGHIDLRSVPGEGTAVTLLLPAIGDDRDIDDAQQEWEGDLRGNDQCVLLVEDDPAVRRFTNNQLRSLGYRTLLAANGHDGLEMLKAHPDVAVLLTDVVMPGGMSGRELAELARVYRPDLPVLFASGYTEDELSRDGRLEDGLVLLNKPYRRVELARRLKQVMARCGVAQDE